MAVPAGCTLFFGEAVMSSSTAAQLEQKKMD